MERALVNVGRVRSPDDPLLVCDFSSTDLPIGLVVLLRSIPTFENISSRIHPRIRPGFLQDVSFLYLLFRSWRR